MKKTLLLSLALFCLAPMLLGQKQAPPFATTTSLLVQNPRIENLDNPIGLDVTQPRFGWQLAADRRNVLQTAYQIQVANSPADLAGGKKLVWDSGKILSDASVWVPYGGPGLLSAKKYWWQVRAWDNAGNSSAWSQPAHWQMGLLSAADWTAKWISLPAPEDSTHPSPMFRKVFSLKKKIAAATAYVTAHGLYEAEINGQRIGSDYLTPGWTAYQKRIQYQAYDVTALLKNGPQHHRRHPRQRLVARLYRLGNSQRVLRPRCLAALPVGSGIHRRQPRDHRLRRLLEMQCRRPHPQRGNLSR